MLKLSDVDWEELIKKYRLQIIVLLGGILLISLGIFLQKSEILTPAKVEIIEASSSAEIKNNDIVVEVTGSVEKPGVYHLPVGSRVEDALLMAGGLGADADRNWVEKTINRAAKLTDGQKVYIASTKQTNGLSASISNTNSNVAQYDLTPDSNLVNINTASLSQLDTLPGIGQVYGQSIIDHRQYSDVGELVSRKVLKQSTFDKIKDKITVY